MNFIVNKRVLCTDSLGFTFLSKCFTNLRTQTLNKMSGYLEVKYPCKSLGLNPFKSWKRQWCILRPSATRAGGSLAVYCSQAGASAGTVELPPGCVVRRTKSRTRPFAFAVYQAGEPRKPRVLLAAHSLHDTHAWMEKITALISSASLCGTESLLKDSYSVTVVPTELSRRCGLTSDSVLSLSPAGVLVSPQQRPGVQLAWSAVSGVHLSSETAEKNRICVINVNSEFPHGAGELKLCSPLAAELVAALRDSRQPAARRGRGHKLSKSDSDLRTRSDSDLGDIRRSSWYSGPSEISLDDIDLVMYKERKRIPSGPLSRCSGEGDLAPARSHDAGAICDGDTGTSAACDSMSDRRSLLSVASGVYEEIPERPEPALYCHMARDQDVLDGAHMGVEEPTYESVADCIYATMRRTGKRHPPPPLPPRLPFGTTKLGQSWNTRVNNAPPVETVTRHSSVGSLPRCFSVGSRPSSKRQNTMFSHRKRLKSDSRIATSPKSETSKENKDVETKKKKFDFAPTRDLFKNFKVGRKMKNLKITGTLAKGEAKSCEFLDETSEHVKSNRCSKSVECLEDSEILDDFDNDLSIDFNDDAVASLALPQEIVDLILRSRDKINEIRLNDNKGTSPDYMPMSPGVPPPPIEQHYMIMSPKTNVACGGSSAD